MLQDSISIRDKNVSLSTLTSFIFRKMQMKIECCIPAVVKSYDRINNIVTVLPSINVITTDGESKERPKYYLPCMNPCGFGLGINFPLHEGDTGWIIACDRDSSAFKETREVSDPEDFNIHLYSFGFFIPDQIKGFTIEEGDEDALVIESLDAQTKITLKHGEITVKGSTVNVISDVSFVTSPTTNWTGDIMLNGSITVTNGDVIADTISLKGHIHTDSKGGNTSAPVAQ